MTRFELDFNIPPSWFSLHVSWEWRVWGHETSFLATYITDIHHSYTFLAIHTYICFKVQWDLVYWLLRYQRKIFGKCWCILVHLSQKPASFWAANHLIVRQMLSVQSLSSASDVAAPIKGFNEFLLHFSSPWTLRMWSIVFYIKRRLTSDWRSLSILEKICSYEIERFPSLSLWWCRQPPSFYNRTRLHARWDNEIKWTNYQLCGDFIY